MKKKNDIILIGVLLAVALVMGIGYWMLQGAATDNPVAVVTIDGEEYGRFPLDKDCQERITLANGAYNILTIQDGVADMTEASCPDKICVNHRDISKRGESITCLPNKVIIEIRNGESSDLDAITN